MKTTEQVKALQEKIAAGKAARAVAVEMVANESAERRLENEALLIDIERERGKTVGIDLGVVWLPTGHMIVVERPPLIDYERFMSVWDGTKPEDKPRVRDELLCSCLIHPKQLELELLSDINGDCKTAACDVAVRMNDVEAKVYKGKS